MIGDTGEKEGASRANVEASTSFPNLVARIAELEKRLEVDAYYDGDGKPIPIPSEERPTAIDGIEARDCTIKLQDERIAELENVNLRQSLHMVDKLEEFQKRIAELEAALEKIIRWGEDTYSTSSHCCVIAQAALNRTDMAAYNGWKPARYKLDEDGNLLFWGLDQGAAEKVRGCFCDKCGQIMPDTIVTPLNRTDTP